MKVTVMTTFFLVIIQTESNKYNKLIIKNVMSKAQDKQIGNQLQQCPGLLMRRILLHKDFLKK